MKIAFVTGGSRGLGRAFVELLADQDYEVLEFSRSGSDRRHIKCDFAEIDQAVAIIEQTFSGVAGDVLSEILLVNNVGTITPVGPLRFFPSERIIANIHVNLLSTLITTGIFAKYFQNHDCRKQVINISSGAARHVHYGWSLYCSAKAGLEHFVATFALEQQKEDHPIFSVIYNPGIMDTDMQEEIRSVDSSLFPDKQRFVDYKRGDRLADVRKVAEYAYSHCRDNSELLLRLAYQQ